MWFQGTTDYCTIHLDNFWEGLENEIASNHTSQGEKVIYQTVQQITQLKDAIVLDEVDSSCSRKGSTKHLSQYRWDVAWDVLDLSHLLKLCCCGSVSKPFETWIFTGLTIWFNYDSHVSDFRCIFLMQGSVWPTSVRKHDSLSSYRVGQQIWQHLFNS